MWRRPPGARGVAGEDALGDAVARQVGDQDARGEGVGVGRSARLGGREARADHGAVKPRSDRDITYFARASYDTQFTVSPNVQSSIFPTDPFNPQTFRSGGEDIGSRVADLVDAVAESHQLLASFELRAQRRLGA